MPDETEFDAVVIGSGLGGLTAAALLTKAGRKVCLLERNSGFGGSASGYRVGALTIEASLHQTANPRDPRDLKHHILKKLGLLDALTWIPVPDLYTVRGGPVGDAFTLPHGYGEARAALSERFPASRDGIGRLLGRMERIYDSLSGLVEAREERSLLKLFGNLSRMGGTVRDWRCSLAEVFQQELGDDEAAKCALAANLSYYGDDPARMWWIFFAVAQGGYLGSGGTYVRGGSRALSMKLAGAVKRGGGTVRLGRNATSIEMDDHGRIRAVHHTARDGGDSERLATRIVLASSAPEVLAAMLPDSAGARLAQAFEHFPLSISLFAAHFGLREPPSRFGLKAFSTALLPDDMRHLSDFAQAGALLSAPPAGRLPPLSIANFGAVDSGLDDGPVESRLTLVTAVGVDALGNWRGFPARRTRTAGAPGWMLSPGGWTANIRGSPAPSRSRSFSTRAPCTTISAPPAARFTASRPNRPAARFSPACRARPPRPSPACFWPLPSAGKAASPAPWEPERTPRVWR
jgi:phytoene dehydrogenase-like protein